MLPETSFDVLFGAQVPNPVPSIPKESPFQSLLNTAQKFLKLDTAVEYHARRIEQAVEEFQTEGN